MGSLPLNGEPAPRQARRSLLLIMLLAAALAACFLHWQRWPHQADQPSDGGSAALPDPRLTFATPYRNVRPEVRYVGDEVCAHCHQEIADRYHRHPMGRSFVPIARLLAAGNLDVAKPISFEAQGLTYAVERRGQRLFHRESLRSPEGEVLAEREAEIRFVIGSGTRGYTFVWGEDGFLFQSPISWYTQKKTWDLSPGYRGQNSHFDGPMTNSCLFCHCNQVEPVVDTQNRYQEPLLRGGAIGCERCHGPGELHVQRREGNKATAAGFDETIVNPRRLEPALREAVCQQCHLQGQGAVMRRGRHVFDYRPGLPVQLFWSVFVSPPGTQGNPKAVGQVEQMYASRCYRASAGKLGCISCHDPHEQPARENRTAFYKSRCLNCHQDQSPCKLPLVERRRREKTDNCVACHMPRLDTDIAHTAATDHRIVRRSSAAALPNLKPPFRPGDPLLLPFYRDVPTADDPEADRDLAVALMQMAVGHHPPELVREALIQQALPRLEQALDHAPEDVEAWEARGHARLLRGDQEGALAAYQAALVHAPHRELTLTLAGAAAEQLGHDAAAREYWQGARQMNPWRWEYPYHLARLAVKAEKAFEALRHCQEALRLNPAATEAHKLHVWCLLTIGKKEDARRAFASLMALKPPQAEAMRRWFAEQYRKEGAPK